MKTVIFDGRGFAKKKEEDLKLKVRNLKLKGVVPKLVTIIVGNDPASVLYVNLKKKAAERVGCELMIVEFDHDLDKRIIINKIKEYNTDDQVNGIMVQLPLPGNFSDEDRDKILNSIALEKDVDGLRADSKFVAPTTKAVLEALNFALSTTHQAPSTICVVGATGNEGKKIVKVLRQEYKNKGIGRLEIVEVNSKIRNLKLKIKNCDVVISVTGVPDLIKADMIKDLPTHKATGGHGGVILIDVGSPKGDIEKAAYIKASFVSPVPGGVGPITISCLLENLIIGTQ